MSANIAKVAKVTRIFLAILASCMLMEERSIHRLVLSVIIKSVTFVTDDFIFAKMEQHYKITGQELIPVKISITIREKQ